MVFLDGQNHLKSYHKMHIDRERLRPAVHAKNGNPKSNWKGMNWKSNGLKI